jgi:hypothetical protein
MARYERKITIQFCKSIISWRRNNPIASAKKKNSSKHEQEKREEESSGISSEQNFSLCFIHHIVAIHISTHASVKISRVSANRRRKRKERNSRYRVEVDKILGTENKAESERTLTGFVGDLVSQFSRIPRKFHS